PHEGESIMKAPFPESSASLINEKAEWWMNTVMEVTRSIRNLRAEIGVPPSKHVECIVASKLSEVRDAVSQGGESIKTLAKVSKLDIVASRPSGEHMRFVSAHLPMADIYIPLAGLVDIDREITRVTNELAEVERELARTASKLANEQFLTRAPAHVVEKEQRIAQELTDRRKKLQERLEMLTKGE
ncbi:MAG: valine--tRNA ligase, partial [Armatimonadota bacterium]|nr:valine--tRNA ligase [Armatimonadota bacterium]